MAPCHHLIITCDYQRHTSTPQFSMPDMALVAPPTSVWRDPNLMASSGSVPGITSMSMSSLPLHHALSVGGGLSPGAGGDGASSPLGGHGPSVSTPIPPSDVSQQSSDNESGGAKDENGQDIVCVVCNDKSSGKHYGQFTCEGESINQCCQLHSTKLNWLELRHELVITIAITIRGLHYSNLSTLSMT